MAIYQGPRRNNILLNAFGIIIDPSLILCYDAGNPYSFIDPGTGTGAVAVLDPVTDLSSAGNNGIIQHYYNDIFSTANGGVFTFVNGGGFTVIYSDTTSIINAFNATPLSVSIWVKPTDTGGTTTQMDIITNRNSTSVSNTDRGVHLSSARQIVLNTATTTTVTGVYVVPNEWYNITFVHTSDNLRCYVNSILRYTRGSASGGTGGTVSIGYNYNISLYSLIGQIGLPLIYNKELSQAEITQNYQSQAARFGHNTALPPLKLYFDPGNTNSYTGSIPTKIYDLSGNNYTGSLSASNATTAQRPVYNSAGGGSLFFNGQAQASVGSGSYIGGFVSGSSAPGQINIGNTYTLDMWLNPTTTATSIWVTTTLAAGYHHYLNSADNTNNVGGGAVTFQANVVANTWYNLVTVRNGDAMWSYLNGIQLTPAYSTGNGTTNFNMFKIGGYQTNSGYYPRGYLGEFKIYSGTLTAVQVYNNFQSSRARYGI